jgi:ADP-ribosylglycohydrolase
LFRGGDTDINAAIAGDMLGAIIGFKNLPKDYLKMMINLKFPVPAQKKIDRSVIYELRYALIEAYKII